MQMETRHISTKAHSKGDRRGMFGALYNHHRVIRSMGAPRAHQN